MYMINSNAQTFILKNNKQKVFPSMSLSTTFSFKGNVSPSMDKAECNDLYTDEQKNSIQTDTPKWTSFTRCSSKKLTFVFRK